MVVTFWLLGWALAPTQTISRPAVSPATPAASARGDWVLAPRLLRGQELVYRGTFTEESSGSRVQFQRAYRFETRFFVLDSLPRGHDLAVLTILHNRDPRPTGNRGESSPSSVRLERLRVDLQGKVTAAPGSSLAVPLEGAPTLEVGAFVEMPSGRLAPNQSWQVAEVGKPVLVWRLTGNETVGGQPCVRLVGVQQSEDWERPRADRGAWRRQDTVWLAPRSGLAQRVERIIEHHEPARREVSLRSTLRYELESGLQYPAQMAQDRRQEVLQVFSLREAAKPLLGDPARNARALQALQRRISYHLENQPPTPYREAMLEVKAQVDAASRGEVVVVPHETPARPVAVASPGEPAPDFVAGPISGTVAARLGQFRGRPILLVFYHPASDTATELLRFAQEVHTQYGRTVHVVGLSVLADAPVVLRQRDALRLSFPICSGGGMRISYGVETTPKMVLIDSTGVIRGMYLGWGQGTAGEVVTDLRRWLPGR